MSIVIRVFAIVSLLLIAGATTPIAAAGADRSIGAASADAATRPLGADAPSHVSSAPTSAVRSPPSVAGAELRLTGDLRLTPDRPGEIEVRLRYAVPRSITGLRAGISGEATVTDAVGFDRRGDEYVWDGSTERPALTYRLPANVTVEEGRWTSAGGAGERTAPRGGDRGAGVDPGGRAGNATGGGYLFVDRGPWALVRLPRVSTRVRGTGTKPTFAHEWTVAGEGAVGESTAFLGAHREHRTEAAGQAFRLVVPEAANLTESPAAVLAALGDAAETLRVGERDDEVFVVAAPAAGVEWGVRGLATGGADAWVRDRATLADPGNTWVHEYVHTRQEYAETNETRWFREASAEYYAALLTLERGRVGFEAFRAQLERGAIPPDAGVTLTDPAAWTDRASYTKGALVAGELDRRIRLSTGGERTLQDVFRRLNRRGGDVDAEAFADAVEAAGGPAVERNATRYLAAAAPDPWDEERHRAAFGPLPPYMTHDLPATGGDAIRVRGPYREGAVGRPAVLAPGETLEVDVRVENRGGTAGDYELAVRVDGRPAENLTGRLEAGAARVEAFSYAAESPGNYTLTVARGDETAAGDPVRIPVAVREPVRAVVSAVRVDRESVTVGESVAITADVVNGAGVPGRAEVTFSDDGEAFASRTVRLGPGEEASVSAERTLTSTGERSLGVAGAGAATVTVRPSSAAERTAADGADTADAGTAQSPARSATDAPTTGTSGGETAASTPGFGVGAAALALCAFLALFRRR